MHHVISSHDLLKNFQRLKFIITIYRKILRQSAAPDILKNQIQGARAEFHVQNFDKIFTVDSFLLDSDFLLEHFHRPLKWIEFFQIALFDQNGSIILLVDALENFEINSMGNLLVE